MAVYVAAAPGQPTPADLFDDLGASIAQRYAEAEQTMIDRIAKLGARGYKKLPDLEERRRTLAALRKEGESLAARLRDPQYIARLTAIASEQGQAAAIAHLTSVFGAQGIKTASGITGTAANAIGQITLDLTNRLDQMSERITRWMPDAYQKVISLVTPQTIAGVLTIQQAQKSAAESFIARGVRGFTDAAGKEWRIGTYAEMATRTSVNRAWMDANIYAMQQNADLHLVSIIIGANACAKCARHGGKIYATDGRSAGNYTLPSAVGGPSVTIHVAGSLAQARAQGWNHPNCRCVVVAYIPGLPVAKGSTYSAEKEQDRDRLRALERRVRDLKRKESAAFDDVTRRRYTNAVKRAQGDIRAHVRETGILRRNYREQLSFSDGKPPKLPPAQGPRPVVPDLPPAIPTKAPVPISATPSAFDRQQKRLDEQFGAVPSAEDQLAARNAPIDYARARTGVEAAKSAAQVAGALEDAFQIPRGMSFTGWTGSVDLDSAKEIARASIDLLEKYPKVMLGKINIGGASRGALASAHGIYGRATSLSEGLAAASARKIAATEIRVSSTVASKTGRAGLVSDVERSKAAGHFHANDADPMYYAITHEFGHILDYNSQTVLRKEVGEITNQLVRELGIELPRDKTLAEFNRHRAQIAELQSGYALKSSGELIAEAFADVEINGLRAKELSKRIHKRLIELYEEARP